jgi:hypothetical protein
MIICELRHDGGKLGSESAVQTSWPLDTRACPIVGSIRLHRTSPSVDTAERVPCMALRHNHLKFNIFVGTYQRKNSAAPAFDYANRTICT